MARTDHSRFDSTYFNREILNGCSDLFEIVKAIRNFWLFDRESYQRKYRNTQNRALMPGYYVVTWPKTSRVRRFDEHSLFRGPFKLSQESQAFRNAMQKHT